MAVESTTPPSLYDLQMLCWLAFGDHGVLVGDIFQAPETHRTAARPRSTTRVGPTDGRGISLPPTPQALLASIW